MEILSLNRSAPRLVQTVATRADVLCLEYVRERRPSTAAPGAQRVTTPGNIICAGLKDGRSVPWCEGPHRPPSFTREDTSRSRGARGTNRVLLAPGGLAWAVLAQSIKTTNIKTTSKAGRETN